MNKIKIIAFTTALLLTTFLDCKKKIDIQEITETPTPEKPTIVETHYPKVINDYLENYFGNTEYKTLAEKLNIHGVDMITSLQYVNEERKIFNFAIVYELKENDIIPHLFIKNAIIYNKNNEVIIDLSEPYEFYGWDIFYSRPEDPQFDKGYVFDYFGDNGTRAAEGPTIEWDNNTKLFVEQTYEMYK